MVKFKVFIQRNTHYQSGKDVPLLIDLLISNNFSYMTFFAQRVFYKLAIGRQSIRLYDTSYKIGIKYKIQAIQTSECCLVFSFKKKNVLLKKMLKKNTVKKNKVQNVFFFFKTTCFDVFKVNIHNLSQFINHTVTLVPECIISQIS